MCLASNYNLKGNVTMFANVPFNPVPNPRNCSRFDNQLMKRSLRLILYPPPSHYNICLNGLYSLNMLFSDYWEATHTFIQTLYFPQSDIRPDHRVYEKASLFTNQSQ